MDQHPTLVLRAEDSLPPQYRCMIQPDHVPAALRLPDADMLGQAINALVEAETCFAVNAAERIVRTTPRGAEVLTKLFGTAATDE